MDKKPIAEIAHGFGLTLEPAAGGAEEGSYDVIKGVNRIFTGNEQAVRDYFIKYENERPGLFEGSVFNYKE